MDQLQPSEIASCQSIPDAFWLAESVYTDKEWIVDLQPMRPPIRLSFTQSAKLVRQLAWADQVLGLTCSDRFAIWMPNVHEWILCAIAGLATGASLVPINTRFKGIEASYLLEKSRAKVIFIVNSFAGNNYLDMIKAEISSGRCEKLETVVVVDLTLEGSSYSHQFGKVKLMDWDSFMQLGNGGRNQFKLPEIVSDAISDIIFTSGTTGNPKGVKSSHFQTLKVFDAWSQIVGLKQSDRYLVINPFFHTFGYKAGIIASIITGCTIYPMALLDIDRLLEVVSEEQISVLPGPPTLYSSILDKVSVNPSRLSSLRLAVTGAAMVPVELIRRMSDELHFETVLTAYGLTESTGTVTMCRQGDSPEIVANTCGRPIPDTQVKVVGEDGLEMGRGLPGEVVVRGYNVMTGYLEDEEQTKLAIDSQGWLHTGDIGVMDAQGYLKITDRKKDMFIVGGFNAYPAEIENILTSNEHVSQSAVIGVPDERMGEVGMAFIVLKPGHLLSEVELLEWARENMANYKVPRKIVFCDELPLNASGKVLKTELRKFASGISTSN